MADPSREAFGPVWRPAAVLVACLLALALPFAVITGLVDRRSGSGEPGLIAGAVPSTSTSTSSGQTTTTGSTVVTGAGEATVSPVDQATEACRLASLRARATLSAADVSLAQFDKHIDAMNLLVAGKISYAVATQFWDETRVGAAQNATAFQKAYRGLAQKPATCEALPAEVAAELPYGDVQSLNRCVTYVSAGAAALRRADTAVKTWTHHIHDMELLRKGDITPAQATSAWKRDWHTGEKQLKAFESAHKQATAAGCALE
jgi:hypothetical protein